MSGTAALCPEFRFINDGVEFADSYTFNPHKWMFTNFDCNCFYVADRKHLIQTLSILPEYLRNQATESGAVIDYRDWHIQLGRRFRSLKLWFVIRHYGIEGLQHHIREHVRLAQQFADWVRDDSRFELAAPAQLNLVCFRLRAGDHDSQANQLLMDRLNAQRRPLPHPYQARWQTDASTLRRPDQHAGPPCGARLAANPARDREAGEFLITCRCDYGHGKFQQAAWCCGRFLESGTSP